MRAAVAYFVRRAPALSSSFLLLVLGILIVPWRVQAFAPQFARYNVISTRHVKRSLSHDDKVSALRGPMDCDDDDDDDDDDEYERPSVSDETTVWLNPRDETSLQGPLSLNMEPWWSEMRQTQQPPPRRQQQPSGSPLREREKRRTMRCWGAAVSTGATADQIRFRQVPEQDLDSAEGSKKKPKTDSKKKNKNKKKGSKSSRSGGSSSTTRKNREWFIVTDVLNETNETLVKNKSKLSATMLEAKSKPTLTRSQVEAAFRIHQETGPDDYDSLEIKVKQLSALLKVSLPVARKMIQNTPALSRRISGGTLAERCIELTLLFKCTPAQFSSVVKRYPRILTYRIETLTRKVVELDRLLTRTRLQRFYTGSRLLPDQDKMPISESTLAIARRVPRLLCSDITGTLTRTADKLFHLLLWDNTTRSDSEKAEVFRRVLRRCPELLLYDMDGNIANKLDQLPLLLPTTKSARGAASAELALKEPRLLTYDIAGSLMAKASTWRERVRNPVSFDAMLAQYPTLLMYSFGAAGRLEYFAYCNRGIKPDAAEARQLLIMSRKTVAQWGRRRESRVKKSLPSLVGGVVTKSGRPRLGETAKQALARRQAQAILANNGECCGPASSQERPVEEWKVVELRNMVKSLGGKPSAKRKHALVQEVKLLGCQHAPDSSLKMRRDREAELLSYSQWIAAKLCDSTSCTCAMVKLDDTSRVLAETLSMGELEKLYGMTLRGSAKAKKRPLVLNEKRQRQ